MGWLNEAIKMHHLAGPRNRYQHVLLHMPIYRVSNLWLQPSHCLLPLLPYLSSMWCLVASFSVLNSYLVRNGLSESLPSQPSAHFKGKLVFKFLGVSLFLALSVSIRPYYTYTKQADTYYHHANQGAKPPGKKELSLNDAKRRDSFHLTPHHHHTG